MSYTHENWTQRADNCRPNVVKGIKVNPKAADHHVDAQRYHQACSPEEDLCNCKAIFHVALTHESDDEEVLHAGGTVDQAKECQGEAVQPENAGGCKKERAEAMSNLLRRWQLSKPDTGK